MRNDPELGAELERLVSSDPLLQIDAIGLLERGRRGRRRRRVASISGLAAGVAAIAVGAALVPDIGAGHREPAATSTATAEALFTPMPGVPQGEAALGLLSQKEAARRCAVRYSTIRLRDGDFPAWSAHASIGIPIPVPGGNPDQRPGCIIPGDSKPTAKAVALAAKDPVPQTADGQLRNCSVQFWHDLTKWRVVTTDRVNTTLNLLAVSPTGRSAVNCTLRVSGGEDFWGKSLRLSIRTAQEEELLPLASVGARGSSMFCPPNTCTSFTYNNFGRVDPAIARIQVKAQDGATHDIAVANGWFSIAWRHGLPDEQKKATLTAYDATGQLLETVPTGQLVQAHSPIG
ncbi:hypothetical protein [Streptomyces sp. SID13031]|uniref:hypothetical protein n=1 Tax=Streptomyces sp. SID13031 TaxID=2706046 RepID=UPI0013CDC979|nr:hypothetical protein [Streptomyces sp. SID13031]NEA34087.1 hypothetical protein [Streptomyces sp. SID13031]